VHTMNNSVLGKNVKWKKLRLVKVDPNNYSGNFQSNTVDKEIDLRDLLPNYVFTVHSDEVFKLNKIRYFATCLCN
jgi:hypothetical protein